MILEYRKIRKEELNRKLFAEFDRTQKVTKCWRKIEGKWEIRDVIFTDQWSEKEYAYGILCLKKTLATGGVVFGAFEGKNLKGFASVEGAYIGTAKKYMDLSCLHVSRDMRGRGIGRMLFGLACEWAAKQGGESLYISAHSAVETQAFYKAMGCVEAEEYQREHVEKEPCDCQMECSLCGWR